MANRRNNGHESFVLPLSLGDRIKKFRELRNMSQRELGIKCGFPESSAAVRIANYESNKKEPREAAIKDLAKALGIHEAALYDTDFSSPYKLIHVLFDLEDLYYLHPVKISEGVYGLQFSCPGSEKENIQYYEIMAQLEAWYKEYCKGFPEAGDTKEDIEKKKKDLQIWKVQYPNNDDKEDWAMKADEMQIRILQARLDKAYAKKMSARTMADITESLKESYDMGIKKRKDFSKMSDFMFLLEDTIKNGLKIEFESPQDFSLGEIHLFSIKIDDFIHSRRLSNLFADVSSGWMTIKDYGIEIQEQITAKEKNLYISFTCSYKYLGYFTIIRKYWKEMLYIIAEYDDPHALELDVKVLEKNFAKKITSEEDCSLDKIST